MQGGSVSANIYGHTTPAQGEIATQSQEIIFFLEIEGVSRRNVGDVLAVTDRADDFKETSVTNFFSRYFVELLKVRLSEAISAAGRKFNCLV